MIPLLSALVVGGGALFALILGARMLDSHIWRSQLRGYRLGFPAGLDVAAVAAWFAHIAATSHVSRFKVLTPPPVVLEVTATSAGIVHTLLVSKAMEGAVLSGLRAALPGVRVTTSNLSPNHP